MTRPEPSVASNPRLVTLELAVTPPSARAAVADYRLARRALQHRLREVEPVQPVDADLEAQQDREVAEVAPLKEAAQLACEAAGLALLAAYQYELARVEADVNPSALRVFRAFVAARLDSFDEIPAVRELLEELDALLV